jgi:hypothetical protein
LQYDVGYRCPAPWPGNTERRSLLVPNPNRRPLPRSAAALPALALALTLALLPSGAARAQFFQNAAGIDSPAFTVTLAEVPLADATPLGDQFAAFGVTFAEGPIFYATQFGSVLGTPPAAITSLFTTTGAVSLVFSEPQSAAAFAAGTLAPQSFSFEALLGGVVVGQASAILDPDTATDNFFGFRFTDGTTFDRIRVTTPGPLAIDDVQLGTFSGTVPGGAAVPEPGAGVLTAGAMLGLVGPVAAARRRSSQRRNSHRRRG